jgi:hypothetical protein
MREWVVEVPGLPATVEELVALRDRIATTPEGGAAVMVLALLAYAQDPALGARFLTVALDQSQLQDGPDGFKGKQPGRMVLQNAKDRIGKAPGIARSYVQGTSNKDDYALPAPPWRLSGREQPGDVQGAKAKTFVRSTGADSPRPVHLAKNERGHWKATNWSSLEVGIKAPPKPADDI